MKKKGFTLIELLAVIVILAVIALIATPIVMTIIENTKKSAAKRSYEMYLSAVETAIVAERLKDNKPVANGTYKVVENGDLCPTLGECNDDTIIVVDVAGSLPTEGKVTIEEEAVVEGSGTILFVEGYQVSYDTATNKTIIIDEEEAKENLKCTIVSDSDLSGTITPGDLYSCKGYGFGDASSIDEGEEDFYVLDESAVGITVSTSEENEEYEAVLMMKASNLGEFMSRSDVNFDHYTNDEGSWGYGLADQAFSASYDQIYDITNSTNLSSAPWLYGNMNDDVFEYDPNYVHGYWLADSGCVKYVDGVATLYNNDSSCTGVGGYRPVFAVNVDYIG